jgi:hypothetical protein
MKPDGVYLCEDTHTSYRSRFGGGLGKPTSFIEYTKEFIDMLNFHHILELKKAPEEDERKKKYRSFRNQTDSVHYYDSVVVLEKKFSTQPPKDSMRK